MSEWDKVKYHGRYNRYPFTEVVAFVLGSYGQLSPDERARTRILDLGCGGAHHLLFLAAEGFDYHGVDGSKESVELARGRLREAGHAANTIVQGVLDALPYEDEYFDVVLDRGTLTCNRLGDLPSLYAEVQRVLRRGGRFFSVMLHRDSTVTARARSLGDGDFDTFTGRLADSGLLHFTDTDEQAALLRNFDIEAIERLERTVELGDNVGESTVWSLSTCRRS